MRGADLTQESLFTTVHLETFVPADHPLRPIGAMVNEALGGVSCLFNAMYAEGGRESIPPERLVRGMLLQVLYSVRSEIHLMEQINYNLVFRWFVGLAVDDPVWNHSLFSTNRERLMEHGAVETLFNEILAQAEHGMKGHFGVDSSTKLIHAVVVTAANTADGSVVGELLHGEETRVWGDKAYDGQREAIAAAAPAAQNHTHDKGHRHRPLTAEQETANRYKSSVRSKVEHPIGTIKRVFGFRKVRYRGIAKNANRLFVASALSNLFMVRRRLLAGA